MSSAPRGFLSYGGNVTAGSFSSYVAMLFKRTTSRRRFAPPLPRPHSMRIMGGCGKREDYDSYPLPRAACALFGPSPMMPRIRAWPRPSGSCRCTKTWVPSYPDLCTGSCSLPSSKGLTQDNYNSRLNTKTMKKTSRQVIEKYYSK